MAKRRMFAQTIIDSDAFLDMSLSTQALYFHLSMRADDEGFINNPKKIQRMVGANDDDIKMLIAKGFLIPFESGVVVIKHWRIHNYIQNDRFTPTVYTEEKSQLEVKENKSYTLGYRMDTECVQPVRVGKDSIGKDSLDKSKGKDKYGEFQNVLLTEEEYKKLKEKFPKDYSERIDNLSIYMRSKGKQYKSHYATILSWARKEDKNKPKEIRPKSHKEFEKEDWERPDFKPEQMPDDVRELLGKVGRTI